MLTFKKNWLWKYNRWCDGMVFTRDGVHNANTLCSYFWGSVYNLIGFPFSCIIMTHTLGFVMGAPLGALGLWEVINNFAGEGSWLGFYLNIILGYLWIGLICLLVWAYIVLLLKPIKRVFKKKSTLENKPSVVKEFLKAKKEKVCPMIEFED